MQQASLLSFPVPSPLEVCDALLAQPLVGVFVVQDGRFRYVNHRFAEVFGYSADEIVSSRSVADLVAEDDRHLVEMSLRGSLDGEIRGVHYDFRGRPSSGRPLHVEVFGLHTQIDGGPAVVGVMIDITRRVLLERQLRALGQRGRLILASVGEGIFGVDPDGRITFANPVAERILGYTEEDLIGRTKHDLVHHSHPDGRPYVIEECPVCTTLREGKVREVTDEVFWRRDGTSFPVEYISTPMLDDGHVAGAVIAFRDISRRKEFEAALRESEERLRLVVQATNDVIWEWDIHSGDLTWSGGAGQSFRYTGGEMGGSIEWWTEHIHPEDRERVVGDLSEALTGSAVVWSAEYRFLRGDGSYAAILDRGHIVRSPRGEPLRAIGAMMDITERRRTEEAQRFLARASALLDASLDAEVTCTSLARLVVPTLADICQIDEVREDGALRQMAVAHVVPAREKLLVSTGADPGEGDLSRHPVTRAVRGREPVLISEVDIAILAPSGCSPEHRERVEQLRMRSLMALPLIAHERVLGAIMLATAESGRTFGPMDLLVAEDLARRAAAALENARLYRAAQEAIRAREEILGVVTHDLRTPLNTIRMVVDLLHDQGGERREEVVQYREMVYRAVSRMDRLIADLMDLSSIDAGRFTVEGADHELGALLLEVDQAFSPLAVEKEISLTTETAGDLPPVWIDARQILRVFSNLLGNALKFTPRGGRVVVHAEGSGNEVVVSVTDTGPGIPPEQLQHVFDRHWQARAGDRRGVGLGLAISKGVVDAHGGRIWAESRPGEGTRIVFTIPTRPPAPPPAPPAPPGA